MTKKHDGKTLVTGTDSPNLPRLIVISGKDKGRQHWIKKRETIIGRTPECDIVIDDSNISRKHARIVHVSGNFFVYDNNSMNGTYVNGKKIAESKLTNDDAIRIGDTEMKFEYEKEMGLRSPRKIKTHPVLPGKIKSKSIRPKAPKNSANSRLTLYTFAILLVAGVIGGSYYMKMQKGNKPKVKTSANNKNTPAIRATPAEILTPVNIKTPPQLKDIPEELRDEDPAAFYSRGLLAMMSKDYKEAIKHFEATLKIDPDHQSAKLKLEQCKALLKKMIDDIYAEGAREFNILYYERAILEWTKVIDLARDFDDTMYFKAKERIKETKKKLKEKKSK